MCDADMSFPCASGSQKISEDGMEMAQAETDLRSAT